MGNRAEPPDPQAGLGAQGRAKGRQHCWWELPIAALCRAGLSCPLGGAGFVTDGSQPPLGGEPQPFGVRPVALVPGSAGSAQPSALASRPQGGKGLFIFPTSQARVAQSVLCPALTGARAPASPLKPQAHVGAQGSLLLLLYEHWVKPLASSGRGLWGRPNAPIAAAGRRGAGSGAPGSTGQEQQLCHQQGDPCSGQRGGHGHRPLWCAEQGGAGGQRWDAGTQRWDSGG